MDPLDKQNNVIAAFDQVRHSAFGEGKVIQLWKKSLPKSLGLHSEEPAEYVFVADVQFSDSSQTVRCDSLEVVLDEASDG